MTQTRQKQSKTIELGITSDNQTLLFDLFKFLESRLLIQASSGGGKSYLLRRIIEQTLSQHIPVWVVDPEGEYSTLREKFDLLIFAEDGDLDLRSETLAATLPVLLKKGISCVFDLSDLNLEEKRHCVVKICQSILGLPKPDWKSLLLCIDEAQIFAPEGKSSASIEAVTDLASRIRKRGVGLVVATQRLSALDKNLTSHLLNRIIGYCLEDIEVARAANYIGKANAKDLQTFQPGDFYALGSALNTRSATKFHCGAVETTHPDPSTRRNLVTPKATTELSSLVAELKSAIAISDPSDDLENFGNNIPNNYQIKELELERREKEVSEREKYYENLDQQIYQKINTIFAEANLLIEAKFEELKTDLSKVFQVPEKSTSPVNTETVPKQTEIIQNTEVKEKTEHRPFEPIKDNFLSRAQRKIIDTLATFENLGLASMDKSNVAVFAGASPKSSAFTANLSFLRNSNNQHSHSSLIQYVGDGSVKLTPIGRKYARPSHQINSREELHNAWCHYLPKKQGEMIRYLLKQGARKSVPRSILAQDTSQSETSSAWTANLSSLRKFGLIEYGEHNGVKSVYLTNLLLA